MTDSISVLHQWIADYYAKNKVSGPRAIASREFGYGFFGRKIATRHVSFASADLFNQFLQRQAPFYISYSTAEYELPEAKPMEAKKSKGAELIFEFDADDLQQLGEDNCYLHHTVSKCNTCGHQENGLPKLCTKCGGVMSVDQEFVCNICLGEVKKQTFKLIDWMADLGISEPLLINFSGSKGYHVHFDGESVRHLSPSARAELADFLSPAQIDWKQLGFDLDSRSLPSTSSAFSWRKKFVNQLQNVIPQLNTLNKGQKEQAIKGLVDGKLFGFTQSGKKDWEYWTKAFDEAKSIIAPSFTIDRQVSIDASRLIRVPDTIHGGTLLVAKTVSINDLKSFNPLAHTMSLSDQLCKVHVNHAPQFTLAEKEFGPYHDELVELPKSVAAYLMAKGLAQLVKG